MHSKEYKKSSKKRIAFWCSLLFKEEYMEEAIYNLGRKRWRRQRMKVITKGGIFLFIIQ